METYPSKEYAWLIQHPEIEEKYKGEWVAVSEEKIVAHGRDLEKILEQTSQLSHPPHITFVEEIGLVAYVHRIFL